MHVFVFVCVCVRNKNDEHFARARGMLKILLTKRARVAGRNGPTTVATEPHTHTHAQTRTPDPGPSRPEKMRIYWFGWRVYAEYDMVDSCHMV